MATFTQWNRNRPLRQVAWVCGPEPVLVREVVSAYTQAMPLVFRSQWWFGDHEESQIWDYLLASPPGIGRLVLVQAAEKAKLAERFTLLTQVIPDMSYVVFVSAEDDFPRTEAKGKQETPPLVPHLAAIQKFREGQLIRCCRPSREEDLLKLVASWWPGAGSNWAARVWERCGDDLTAAWQACDTARRAGLAPGMLGHLDMACHGVEGAAFADSLISGNTVAALSEARTLGARDALAAVAMLNANLGQARRYASLSALGLGPDEIARRGFSRYRQHALDPYAARYTPARELRCRRVLALAEDTLRSGVRTGVLEAVAALW